MTGLNVGPTSHEQEVVGRPVQMDRALPGRLKTRQY